MMYQSTLVAAAGVLMLWATGCGSAPQQRVVLIEPEYSYTRHEPAIVKPLGPASARGQVNPQLDRVP